MVKTIPLGVPFAAQGAIFGGYLRTTVDLCNGAMIFAADRFIGSVELSLFTVIPSELFNTALESRWLNAGRLPVPPRRTGPPDNAREAYTVRSFHGPISSQVAQRFCARARRARQHHTTFYLPFICNIRSHWADGQITSLLT